MKKRQFLSISTSLFLISANLSAEPVIESINPEVGSVAETTVVDITGSGFTDVTEINFGETPVETFTVNSDTSITVIVPESTPEVVNVTVTTEEGTSETTEDTFYTYQGNLEAYLTDPENNDDETALLIVDATDPEAEVVATTLEAEPAITVTAEDITAAVAENEEVETPAVVAITPDQAPLAKFTSEVAVAGNASTFDASNSTTPSGTIVLYSWNFGDGEELDTTDAIVSHTYGKPGKYAVELKVTNSAGTSTIQTSSDYAFSIDAIGSYNVTLTNNGGPTAAKATEVNVGVASPLDFKVEATNSFNQLSWKAPLSGGVVSYRIYRDAGLKNFVAEVFGEAGLMFSDRLKSKKDNRVVYYLVAVGEESVSEPVSASPKSTKQTIKKPKSPRRNFPRRR